MIHGVKMVILLLFTAANMTSGFFLSESTKNIQISTLTLSSNMCWFWSAIVFFFLFFFLHGLCIYLFRFSFVKQPWNPERSIKLN